MIIGNPIQLAAISNYKLAQLTFAPSDFDSLRKTALIKNVQEHVYKDTPKEWLEPMTRWTFFTPESLDDMTQDTLENIFRAYVRMIEQFHPCSANNVADEDDEDEERASGRRNRNPSIMSEPSSIFSQPNLTLSNEGMDRYPVDKPLPNSPITDEMRRRSIRARMSWTSDTGLTSNALSQTLANEMVGLFDMDFSVDIKISSAPRLPELAFAQKRKSQHRVSIDSLMSLIPAFETFQLPDTYPDHSSLLPARTSSLRNRQTASSPSLTLNSRTERKGIPTPLRRIGGADLFSDLSKKTTSIAQTKPIRKLAALVVKRKSPPLKTKEAAMSAPSLILSTSPKFAELPASSNITIASTNTNMSLSSTSDHASNYAYCVGNMYSEKPLPSPPLDLACRSSPPPPPPRGSSPSVQPCPPTVPAKITLDVRKPGNINSASDSDLPSQTSSVFLRMLQRQPEAMNENDNGQGERRRRRRSLSDYSINQDPQLQQEVPIPVVSSSFTHKMATFGRRIASPIRQQAPRVDC